MMTEDTYRDKLNSLQVEIEELRAKLKESQTRDTISRQAAIDKFEPWLKVQGYSEGELNMLKAVLYELRLFPSAQPEQRWIPCSERLPEEKKDVLAVDDEGFFYIAQYSVYNKRGFWEETTEYISIDAVAWQPLPEPWKGEF